MAVSRSSESFDDGTGARGDDISVRDEAGIIANRLQDGAAVDPQKIEQPRTNGAPERFDRGVALTEVRVDLGAELRKEGGAAHRLGVVQADVARDGSALE